MKKIVILAFILAFFVLTFGVYANNDAPIWRFNDTMDIIAWNYDGCTYNVCDKYIEITPTGTDPQMLINILPSQRFEAENMPYIAVRMKIVGGNCASGFFYGTTKFPKLSDTQYSPLTLVGDNEWHDYIIDMTSDTNGRWKSTLNVLRFDILNGDVSGKKAQIDRLGIFRTRVEAKAFLSETLSENKGILPLWDFKLNTTKDNWIAAGATLSFEKGVTKFVSNGIDPMIILNLKEIYKFNAAQYPYFAYRAKVKSDSTLATLFYKTTDFPTWSPDNSKAFSINLGGAWGNYVVDMSQVPTWSGKITDLRIDAVNNNSEKDRNGIVYLDKCGFFATAAEAEKFLSTNIARPEDGEFFTWDFSDYNDFKEWDSSGCTLVQEQNAANMVPSSTDPIMSTYFDKTGYLDADTYPIVAVRAAIKSSVDLAGFFFEDADEKVSIIEDSYSPFKINNGGNWTNYIIDLSDKATYPKDKWHGMMNRFRIDPINSTDYMAKIFIDRVGFFQTTQQAHNFLNASTAVPINFESVGYQSSIQKDDDKKIIIPNGLGLLDYNASVFNFSSNDFVGRKSYSTQPFIAMYKPDATSNFEPLALSYVTSKNYPSVVASRKGIYKLGYYSSEIEDCENHWAEKYINFVTERAIFNGTSTYDFSPEMPLTRAMFITALGRLANADLSLYDGNTSFNDVSTYDYYAKYLDWAESIGILSGIYSLKFKPEEAISREEMALITNRYIDIYNFSIRDYNNISAPSDLITLSDLSQAAVISMIDLGIMKPIEAKKFDATGIITRADGAEFFTKLIKVILAVGLYDTYDAEYFKQDKIRTTAWTSINAQQFDEEFFRNYADCGFNWILASGGWDSDYLFSLADKYGIEVYTNDDAHKVGNYKKMNSYYDHPSFGGHYVTDEPGSDDFAKLAADCNPYFTYTGGKIPFINLLPMYANDAQLKYGASAAEIDYYDPTPGVYRRHCQEFVDTFNAPYICTDIYPLQWRSGVKTTYKDYCESIHQIANVARNANYEFWCCIQTFAWTASVRTPNEAEYRWQCYTLFSFGCTGILAWRYEGYNDKFPSLVDIQLKNTQSYYDLKAVLEEVNLLSDVFMQYRNLGVFNHNYSTAVPYLYVSEMYTGFDSINDISCADPLLFGCFEKKQGIGRAFTVVNMSELKLEKSSTVTFKVPGNKTITAYPKGIPTILTPKNGIYTITLATGEGVFVTIE